MDAVDILLNGFSVVKGNPKVILVYFLLSVLSVASMTPVGLVLLSNKAAFVNIAHANLFTPNIAKFATELILSVILAAILILLISLLIQPLFVGMIIEVGLRSASGEHIPLSAAFDKAKSRYVKLVWTNFAVSVIEFLGVLAVAIPLVIILVAGTYGAAFILLLLLAGLVIAIAYIILAAILLYLAMPVVMAENRSGMDAVRMSYNITRKDKAGIFAIFVIIGIISFFASIIIGNVIGALGSTTITALPTTSSIAIFVIFTLLLMLIDGFVYSWLLITSGLMYRAYKKGVLGGKPGPDKKAG